jgi:endonuclease YncB( thermonuclease family)
MHDLKPAKSSLRGKGLLCAALFLLLLLGCGESAAEWVSVRRVNDGDTVELTDGRLVRYIGINTPEIDHAHNAAEPFGFAARRKNLELVGGKRVRLEYDQERFDQYRRALAYVFLADGAMVNAALLRSGHAYVLFTKPNVKYERQMLEAQREAMQAKRGIWQGWNEKDRVFVGNRNSRRFHLETCPQVRRMHRENRVRFTSRWEAFKAGHAPSKECQPEFRIPAK